MTSIDETLAQLRRAADSTAATLAAVRAAAPEETTATDDSGAVAVSVDRRGRPVGVRVADDWTRRTTPEELGRAVLAAAGAAGAELGRAMSDALRTGATEAADALPVEPVAVPAFEGTPRPLADLAELAVAQLGGAASAQPAAPATASGSAGTHVTVTLAASGLVGCDVDGRWAATQSGIALSTAVNQALGEAARALVALDQRRQEQDTVLAEAFAHLRALAPATTEGEARA